MNRDESPLFIKARLLAIYGNYTSRLLAEAKQFRTASQFEGATLSVANNISEAQSPSSRRDFIAKLKIAQREAYEAETICVVITDSHILSSKARETMLHLIDDICRMLTASIITAKRNERRKGGIEE